MNFMQFCHQKGNLSTLNLRFAYFVWSKMSIEGIIMFLGINITGLKRKILIILDFENGFLPTYLPLCQIFLEGCTVENMWEIFIFKIKNYPDFSLQSCIVHLWEHDDTVKRLFWTAQCKHIWGLGLKIVLPDCKYFSSSGKIPEKYGWSQRPP